MVLRALCVAALAVAAAVTWSAPADAQAQPLGWQFGEVPDTGVADAGAASVRYGVQTQVFFQSDGNLRHVYRVGSEPWTSAVLDGDGGPGDRTSATVGAGASAVVFGTQLQVFYIDETNGRLRHGFYVPLRNAWRFADLDGPGVTGGNGRSENRMGGRTTTVLYRGGPHVFYADNEAGTLRHAWWNGRAWFFETLDGAGGGGGRVKATIGPESAAVTSGRALWVFYRNSDAGRLRMAQITGPAWTFADLDGTGVPGGRGRESRSTGSGPSAVVFDGQPHVFYRSDEPALRQAWRSPTGAWSFQTLMDPTSCPPWVVTPATTPGSGYEPCEPGGAVAATVFGAPQVFHLDALNRRLVQSWWTGTQWLHEIRDGPLAMGAVGVTADPVGGPVSVSLTPTGPQVLVRHTSTGTLRSGGWGPSPPGLHFAPYIDDPPVPGEVLRAGGGLWTDEPSVRIQWQRCAARASDATSCRDIDGATSSTYPVGVDDIGFSLRVVETATNSVGSNVAASARQDVAALRGVVQVDAGYGHSCAVIDDGTVRCWGSDLRGVLGDGADTSGSRFPGTVSGLTDAVEVSTNHLHACARLRGGTVWCWGANEFGQLGDGTRTDSAVPVEVAGITTAVEVDVSDSATCARLADATVRCWGRTMLSGVSADTTSVVPVEVPGIATAISVRVGCVVLADGTIRCWGLNTSGRLGNGSFDDSLVPVAVSGITNAVRVSGGSNHRCAVLADGTVRCWGSNSKGQLGGPVPNPQFGFDGSKVPLEVPGVTGALEVSVGDEFTCARSAAGGLTCWGENSRGQIGNGESSPSGRLTSRPVAVSGLSDTVASASGTEHSCAVLADTTVRCWGGSVAFGGGALGNGSLNFALVPRTVADP